MRPSARLRFALITVALPALALLGAAVAVSIPAARADLVPTLSTVTVPSLPVSVPTVPALPIGSTGTATTPPTTTTAGGGGQGGGSTTSSGRLVAAGSGVAGAILLPSGAVSVPISSVTAPARLVIDRITISPKWVGVRGQHLRLLVRVSDSRGYRVRGASVVVRSAPAGMVKPVGARKTSTDGSVSLQLSTTSLVPMRAGSKLTLVVRAYQAGAALTGSNVARRVVWLPVRPR